MRDLADIQKEKVTAQELHQAKLMLLRDIPLASYRAPVRPLPLSVVAETQEHAGLTRHWDTWFGMPSQYVPYWDAPRSYTSAGRPTDDEPADGK